MQNIILNLILSPFLIYNLINQLLLTLITKPLLKIIVIIKSTLNKLNI